MKKSKKDKTPSKFKAWKLKMKETAKGRAYLKLIYWAIFFAILFIILTVASMMSSDVNIKSNNSIEEDGQNIVNDKEENDVKSKTIEEMEQELLNGEYEYTYDIVVGNNTYLFEGTRYDTYEEGYKNFAKDTLTGVIKYYIDETGIYQVIRNEHVVVNDFYEGLEANFFDVSYLFKAMNSLGLNLKENKLNVYETRDEIYNYELYLDEDLKCIESIKINSIDGISSYNLSFKKLGEY